MKTIQFGEHWAINKSLSFHLINFVDESVILRAHWSVSSPIYCLIPFTVRYRLC